MFNSDMIDVMLLKNIYKTEQVVAILIVKKNQQEKNILNVIVIHLIIFHS